MKTGVIKGDRIAGIDALRAFALFGILMVHVTEGFGFYAESVGNLNPRININFPDCAHNLYESIRRSA